MKRFLLMLTMLFLLLPVISNSFGTTTPEGRKFIQRFEGLRLNAYRCPAGVWTIGYGNTSEARPGKIITKDIAEEYLIKDLQRFERHINYNSERVLMTNEFDALCSFTFNCGYRIKGELKAAVNKRNTTKVKLILNKYIHAKKKVLTGLVRRRAAESKLYEYNLYW